jgi:O-antigen/teichoic acid export membrane protein
MGWIKVAGAAAAILVALFVVSAVIGWVIWAAFAALFVAAVVLLVKAVAGRKRAAPGLDDRELEKPVLRSDVDAELAQLKRDMGGSAG